MTETTMKNLIIGVVGSLVAAVIVALVSAFLAPAKISRFYVRVFRRTLAKKLKQDPQKAMDMIVGWLKRDQSRRGIHFGQFGSGANLQEEKLFQDTREKLEAKPRLYLTGWPCFILHRLGLGKHQLSLVSAGVKRLLKNGPVEVSLGASEQTPPDSQPTIRSYRHTIRGAQILAVLEPDHSLVSQIVALMLDRRNGWQNIDGGWKQCDRERTASDLWGSSYAAGFFARLLQEPNFDAGARKKMHEMLIETIDFLKRDWYQNGWRYSGASSEQNGVQIFHETFQVIKVYDPSFAAELRKWIKGWLSPNGLVSDSYATKCKKMTFASINARVAYAFFLAEEGSSLWKPLCLAAIDRFEEGVNSADASFLLHMISEMKLT